ncbi:hypothetical protein DES53_104440 [Roseimicrobium gellanilyticum]|uniref:Uncharacterized protein n=1 Tax=Roseimicrobium gellanilyticum TaxID=748857 RepID=A0A366HN85_9BACT|nr:hypothetical protein [Roseimicrobium gellanilyticum]RBP44618.1 hypothetical protein DES53_104440 [Roseimicrobium gellanilyticum]
MVPPRFPRSFSLLTVLAACLWQVGPVSAQSTWDGQTDANWSTATNWNPDGEPTLTRR